ncbi:Pumilio domain-containing protein C6G9.14 [Hondaea fermentalgiana]|uniref:Pumilio domain-containing protein C6G9.14 n=1 Tax=Hondaea fermentalgiana TaxID=2315210 RepID=A0A2R5GFY9_9STRA|nr:Pumilio domain-containing protein C6G9.14 [Hondaea fermentalgiana]|eukprot:GBG29249.1 Pumilio domain-containing protein C6G9.14 [Hondaea fermentalgiana]
MDDIEDDLARYAAETQRLGAADEAAAAAAAAAAATADLHQGGGSSEDSPERPTSAPPKIDIADGALFSWMEEAAAAATAAAGNEPRRDSNLTSSSPPSHSGVSVLQGSESAFLSNATSLSPSDQPSSHHHHQHQQDQHQQLAAEAEDTFEDNFGSSSPVSGSSMGGAFSQASSTFGSYDPMEHRDARDARRRTQSIEKFLAQSPGSILAPRKKYVENSNGVPRTALRTTTSANEDDAMQFINMESPGHSLKSLRKRIDELDLNTDYQEYQMQQQEEEQQQRSHQSANSPEQHQRNVRQNGHNESSQQDAQHVASIFTPIGDELAGASPVSPGSGVPTSAGGAPPPLTLHHAQAPSDVQAQGHAIMQDSVSSKSSPFDATAAAPMYHFDDGTAQTSSGHQLHQHQHLSSHAQQTSAGGLPMYSVGYDQQQGLYMQGSYDGGYGQHASMYPSAANPYYSGSNASNAVPQKVVLANGVETMMMPMMSHGGHWTPVAGIPPPPPGPPPSDMSLHHSSLAHQATASQQHHHHAQHHHLQPHQQHAHHQQQQQHQQHQQQQQHQHPRHQHQHMNHDQGAMIPPGALAAHHGDPLGPASGHANNGHGAKLDASRGRGGRKGGISNGGPGTGTGGGRRGGGALGGKRGGRGAGGPSVGGGAPMGSRLEGLGGPSLQAPLEEMRDSIFQLSKEQQGCRFLQVKVDTDGDRACQVILDEVRSRLVLLMLDPFGNYLFQKLLERATVAQRALMLEEVESKLIEAALNLHGTRSVQKFIEVTGGNAPTYDQLDLIVEALRPHVTRLSMDTNGNHVIQRCLQYIPHDRVGFVYETVIKDVLVITRHRHGCCVFQRCLDAADDKQRAALVDKVIEHAIDLMQDPFSNYVVQYVLEKARADEGDRIVHQLKSRLVELSTQKFSSNVVEKCLQHASPVLLEPLIEELCQREVTRELLNDSYGNYVAQRALHVASDAQGLRLVAAFRPHMTSLATSNASCARRVSSRVVKRFPNLASDPLFSSFLQRDPKSVP